MAIKISTIFIVLVAPATLAENGFIGYHYRVPSDPSQLPSNLRPNFQKSYYTNQNGQLQNGFVSPPVYHQHYAGDVNKNQQTQQGYHNVESAYEDQNYHSFTPNFGSGNFVGAQNVQQTEQASPTRNPSFSNITPQQPIITKHIYFHLPPPDDTATATPVMRLAPKKTYNIIFIKLPSQQSASASRLQQLVSQRATAESKTLIYVLVKKPETSSIHPVTSKPEVFFVKYKEPRNVAQPVNSGLVQVQAPQNSASGLLPGQINGHVDK